MKLIHRYENAETYEEEQIALKEIAEANNATIHAIRGKLVNMGIYNNKEKKPTRILKSTYVDKLIENLEPLNETEIEYLERLTVALLQKIIRATDK